jgi:allantoinase
MDVWNDSAEWLLVRAGRRRCEAPRMSEGRAGPVAALARALRLPADHAAPRLALAERRRLAVYLGFNLEHFAFGDGLGACLGPASPQPDVLNYSWREYGNRVGAWRCLELFDALALPAARHLNTALYDHCPELVAACVARGDELVGHGHTNAERQGGWSEAHERALLLRCRERMLRESGQAPAGWLSPWISESA